MYDKLIADLKEDAEWAAANEWETPIMLSDHLKQAVEAIEELCKEIDTVNEANTALYGALLESQNNVEEKCKEWLKVKGKCPTCARCSDNREHTTTCPIEEHYALPLDGYCYLYEEKK